MNDIVKDPQAELDYAFDWSDWLSDGETITSFTLAVDAGLTIGSSSEATGIITYWLSGGTDSRSYTVTCHIETSAGRKDERSLTVYVRNR